MSHKLAEFLKIFSLSWKGSYPYLSTFLELHMQELFRSFSSSAKFLISFVLDLHYAKREKKKKQQREKIRKEKFR